MPKRLYHPPAWEVPLDMREEEKGGQVQQHLSILHEQYRAPLMSYFMRRVGSVAEAEDLTQETFVRLLVQAQRQKIDEPGAYLFYIATNLLRDRARKAHVRNQAMLSDLDHGQVSAVTQEFVEAHTPERVLEARDDVAQVARILNELDERTRDIYVLFRLEKMKHREIAALYGISVSTVEKEIMRANLHLAWRLGRQER